MLKSDKKRARLAFPLYEEDTEGDTEGETEGDTEETPNL